MSDKKLIDPFQQNVVLVTGLSGAGRSTCLKILEDYGFEAIDNIPLSFIPALLSHSSSNSTSEIKHITRQEAFGDYKEIMRRLANTSKANAVDESNCAIGKTSAATNVVLSSSASSAKYKNALSLP